MSQGGSAPYDYGPHGNGPHGNGPPPGPAFGPPLNSNEHNSNQYGPNSFSTQEGRFNPYLGPSNPAGHRNPTNLPHRFPNPNRGVQSSDQQNHRSLSPLDEQMSQSLQTNPHYRTNTNQNLSMSNPIQSIPLPVFDTLATQAQLTNENRERARIVSNRMENDSRLIGLVVYTAQCHQEIVQKIEELSASTPSPTHDTPSTNTSDVLVPRWKPREELKKFCADALLESIGNPDLQAYTDTEGVITLAGQKKTLSQSLEMIVTLRIQNQDPAWKARNFPNGSQARFPKEVVNHIKQKAKSTREHLHAILRHNACSKHGSTDNPLPTLQDLFVTMADFPGLDRRTTTDKEVIKEGTNNLSKSSRYAYLRMEAVFLEVTTQGNGSAIWKTVDQRLGNLRLNGARFTEAFYKLILDEDKRLFNGQTTLADLQALTDYKLPNNERVNAAMSALPILTSSNQQTNATEA